LNPIQGMDVCMRFKLIFPVFKKIKEAYEISSLSVSLNVYWTLRFPRSLSGLLIPP
jgi:hypothetical protein